MGRRPKPGEQRGVRCGRCGADEWRELSQGRGRKRGWRCLPCLRGARRVRIAEERRDLAVRLLLAAKRRARDTGVACHLTVDDVRAALPDDGRCPALGIPLVVGDGVQHDASPSLDRLNNAWGYEPGNIAVLSLRANRAKGDLTAAELERIAAWMRERGLN